MPSIRPSGDVPSGRNDPGTRRASSALLLPAVVLSAIAAVPPATGTAPSLATTTGPSSLLVDSVIPTAGSVPSETSKPRVGDAPAPPYPGIYAFVNVNVVPMDARRVLEGHTVVVRDGVVREMGPVDAVSIPANAVVIDGEGRRYLLPGLGDMYARLPDADASGEALEDLLFLYLANGVTTIRQGTGGPGQLSLEGRLRQEEILGPTLFVTSPPLEYRPTFDADSMNAAITAVARAGWDLVRVPNTLSLEGWNLLAGEIEDYAIGFGGPVPDPVGLHHALATGVSTVDHLDGLIEAAASDALQDRIRSWHASADMTGSGTRSSRDGPALGGGPTRATGSGRLPPPPLDSLAATLSVRKARAVAGKARAAGVWMVPTLSWWEMRQSRERPEALLERPEMRYVPRETRGSWVRQKRALPFVDSLTAARTTQVRMATTKALNDVAGGLVLGTDSPALFNVPGFSVHREMELMRDAGITPYEVLLAATRSVADYASGELGESGGFGTVATGNRADLILVEENPLEDLSTLRRQAGVMVKGRWLSRAEIESRLEEIAARHEGPVE